MQSEVSTSPAIELCDSDGSIASQAEKPRPDKFFTAEQIAKKWGVSPSGWYSLVKNGTAPPAALKKPWRWSDTQLHAFKKEIRSIRQIESAKPGWKWVENAGCSNQIYVWIKDKVLKEQDDYEYLVTKRKRGDSTRIVRLLFVRMEAIDALCEKKTERRSDSLKASWDKRETLREALPDGRKRTLILPRVAARMLEVDNTTVYRWMDKDGGGCAYNGNKPFRTYHRDSDGAAMPVPRIKAPLGVRLAPNGNAIYEWLDLAEVEMAVEKKGGILSKADADKKHRDNGTLSRSEASNLYGIPDYVIDRKSIREEIGLVGYEVPIMHVCKRGNGIKSGPIKTREMRITIQSLDEFARHHPSVLSPKDRQGVLTIAQSDNLFGEAVSQQWCEGDLLEHSGTMEYWTQKGLKKGYLPTLTSVKHALEIFNRVKSHAETEAILKKLRDERIVTQSAEQQRTTRTNKRADRPESETNMPTGRPRSKAVNEYYKICADHVDDFKKAKFDSMKAAYVAAAKMLPPNYLGDSKKTILEDRIKRMKNYAKRYRPDLENIENP